MHLRRSYADTRRPATASNVRKSQVTRLKKTKLLGSSIASTWERTDNVDDEQMAQLHPPAHAHHRGSTGSVSKAFVFDSYTSGEPCHCLNTSIARSAPSRHDSHHSRSSGITGWESGTTDFFSVSRGRAFRISTGREIRRHGPNREQQIGQMLRSYLAEDASPGGWRAPRRNEACFLPHDDEKQSTTLIYKNIEVLREPTSLRHNGTDSIFSSRNMCHGNMVGSEIAQYTKLSSVPDF